MLLRSDVPLEIRSVRQTAILAVTAVRGFSDPVAQAAQEPESLIGELVHEMPRIRVTTPDHGHFLNMPPMGTTTGWCDPAPVIKTGSLRPRWLEPLWANRNKGTSDPGAYSDRIVNVLNAFESRIHEVNDGWE